MAQGPRRGVRPDLVLDGDDSDGLTPKVLSAPTAQAKDAELEDDAELEKARALADLKLECPVCLQICTHPVRLPCNHVFCFLCIKGVANHSKKCALCRHDIPVDYLNNPVLLDSDQLVTDSTRHHSGYQWYYEGRNGWWQYDERASRELEDKFVLGTKLFELLIAGFLYIIDFENMYQLRRNDPSRRRRLKRDLVTIEKKGVAGLKVVTPSVREGAYGAEGEKSASLAPLPLPVPTRQPNDTDLEESPSSPVDEIDACLDSLRLDLSVRSTDGAEANEDD